MIREQLARANQRIASLEYVVGENAALKSENEDLLDDKA